MIRRLARSRRRIGGIRLSKGKAGIRERPPAPTPVEFAPRFRRAIETVCAEKLATAGFYEERLRGLLADSQLAGAHADAIDESLN
jgi:hypothetical protein